MSRRACTCLSAVFHLTNGRGVEDDLKPSSPSRIPLFQNTSSARCSLAPCGNTQNTQQTQRRMPSTADLNTWHAPNTLRRHTAHRTPHTAPHTTNPTKHTPHTAPGTPAHDCPHTDDSPLHPLNKLLGLLERQEDRADIPPKHHDARGHEHAEEQGALENMANVVPRLGLRVERCRDGRECRREREGEGEAWC